MTKDTKFILNLILPPLIVYAYHLSILPIYFFWPPLDIITHTLGGGAIAWSWVTFQRKFQPNIKPWFSFVTTIGIVMLVATLWEFHEFLLDKWTSFNQNQPSVGDTMADYFFGMLGATIIAFIRKK